MSGGLAVRVWRKQCLQDGITQSEGGRARGSNDLPLQDLTIPSLPLPRQAHCEWSDVPRIGFGILGTSSCAFGPPWCRAFVGASPSAHKFKSIMRSTERSNLESVEDRAGEPRGALVGAPPGAHTFPSIMSVRDKGRRLW